MCYLSEDSHSVKNVYIYTYVYILHMYVCIQFLLHMSIKLPANCPPTKILTFYDTVNPKIQLNKARGPRHGVLAGWVLLDNV